MLGAGGVSGFFVFVPLSIMSILPTKAELQGKQRPSASLPLVRRDSARDPSHLQHIFSSVYSWYNCLVRQGGAFRYPVGGPIEFGKTLAQPILRLGVQIP